MNNSVLVDDYQQIRQKTEEICRPLQKEDYVVQPIVDVSPPKWHLGHTTWFFETFILKQYITDYKEFDKQYNFVFNSYYEAIGARVIRTDRGNLRASKTAKERYKSLISQHPDIVKRIPLRYIASYLGITAESLSRIRNSMANER